MIDLDLVRHRTGWDIRHESVVDSTNSVAARLRDQGTPAQTGVIADAQDAGRGRAGRQFVSPPGGFYVSLLVDANADDLPGPMTAAVSVAVAEAVEATAGIDCGIKWPNDLWVDGRKLGGILLEAADTRHPVVVGIGLNLGRVPRGLPAEVRASTEALETLSGMHISRHDLLCELLPRIDQRVEDLTTPEGRVALEATWQRRLVLLGERIRYVLGSRPCRGRLLGISLEGGLHVDDVEDGPVWRRPEHVHDVRPN